jgi:arylsulfatase A-like enzyme
VSSELATTMDLYTTVIGIAGGVVPDDRPVDGYDILPLLTGTAGSPREVFFYSYPDRLDAVRDGEWKLVVRRIDPQGPVTLDLYNLKTDPYERFTVAQSHPEVVERLRRKMLDFAEETGAILDLGER